ncbi:MAG: hypothetical protein D6689_16420 [Deltaproteobacteria bacterium]|nr:MAG: hypothetical protein D6689_16420 [Deltaproteobacteria bacterium]
MRTEARVSIERSADDCYQLMCDVERAPAWLAGLAAVEVVERDADGRVVRAWFTAMPARGSLRYALRYDYDPAQRVVQWRSEEVALRELRGEARFTPAAPADSRRGDRCILTYVQEHATSDALPAWARAVLAEESAEAVACAFRRWVETA